MIHRLADRVRVVLALAGPLGAGSRVLLLRLIDRFGWKTVGAGAVLAVYAAARYRTWIVWGIVLWCAAAWMHTPKPDAEEVREQPPPAPDIEAVRQLLLEVMGDADGVHLKTVLAYLQEHGQWEGKEVADLRKHLELLGVPVEPKLKVGGVPTRGVRRAALEALSPAAETEASPDESLPA